MIINAILLFVLGLFFLIGAIVAVIFSILSFANNRSSKYGWLSAFLICLAALIVCVFIFVQKAVHKVEGFTKNLTDQMKDSMGHYSDSLSVIVQPDLSSNEQVKLLKSYSANFTSVPEQFYNYLGFETYYRFPLTYPYSIHCNLFKDAGELYNEVNVKRFDENDNGERKLSINNIDRIAFDANYLLIDQKIKSTRSSDFIHHYILFDLKTEKTEEANSEKELVKLARQKNYKGSDTLITLEQYDELFK